MGVRFDLEGKRLYVKARDQVWIIINGVRHLITSSSVYDSLFQGNVDLLPFDNVDSISRGLDLLDGTSLIKERNGQDIYLLVPIEGNRIFRHRIKSYAAFELYGFSLELVVELPPIVVKAMPVGDEIFGLS